MKHALTVKLYRNKFHIFAGKSKLTSKGYASKEAADQELKDNHSFYAYWAGSCSVSVENSEPKVIHV